MLPLIAIFGPTGVGKTAVAIAVAERLRAQGEDPVAIGADALQLYEGLPILTGAADVAEQQQLEHRLIGVLPVTDTCSAGRYARMAHDEIDAAIAGGRRPIVVGGTGLYLRAALTELDLKPPPDPALREKWIAYVAANGAPAAHAQLAGRDPAAAARVLPTDTQRIVRALELLDAGHEPPAGEQLWTTETRLPTRMFGLTMDREALYERIGARVDAMWAQGVEEEVRTAYAGGASITARKAVGFDEVLAGDRDAMKARTRRYAKRQLTWMRKLPAVTTIDVTGVEPDEVARQITAAAG